MSDLNNSSAADRRMAEIAEACAKTDAPPEFLEQLAKCRVVGDDPLRLEGPNEIDAATIAHNVGASMSRDVTVETPSLKAMHEHRFPRLCRCYGKMGITKEIFEASAES